MIPFELCVVLYEHGLHYNTIHLLAQCCSVKICVLRSKNNPGVLNIYTHQRSEVTILIEKSRLTEEQLRTILI